MVSLLFAVSDDTMAAETWGEPVVQKTDGNESLRQSWGAPVPAHDAYTKTSGSMTSTIQNPRRLIVTSGVSTNEHRLANTGAFPVMGHEGVPMSHMSATSRIAKRKRGTSNGPLGRKRPRNAHRGPRRAALTGDGLRARVPKYPPFARVKKIKFSRLDEETLKRISVVDVTQSMVYDRDRPKENGVNDSLMGPIDRRIRCGVCHYGPGVCDGHFGRILLPVPVYDEGCLKDLLRIMRVVCVFCCRITLDANDPRVVSTIQGLEECTPLRDRAASLCAIGKARKSCMWCKMPKPNITKKKKTIGLNVSFTAAQLAAIEEEGETAHKWALGPWTPACVQSVLHAVPRKDWVLLGFLADETSTEQPSPVRMILTSHVCPPTTIRHTISMAENSKMRGQDDLTGISQLITKQANTIRRILNRKHDKEAQTVAQKHSQLASLVPRVPTVKDALSALSVDSPRTEKKQIKMFVTTQKAHQTLLWRLLSMDMANQNKGLSTALPEGAPVLEDVVEEILMRANPKQYYASQVFARCHVETSRWLATHYSREYEALQFAVSAFKKNDARNANQAKQRSGRAMRGIGKRLKGKQGRFRGNLQGKRCDQNARSVITPDPAIPPDKLGVPFRIMRRLTLPEKVTSRNIDELQQAVYRGPNVDHGATRVLKGDGTVVHLRYHRERHLLQLRIGWIVMRHLKNGDVTLFNRQPSLHKQNIMAFVIEGVPGDTIRMNLSQTTPFNADFDGDEMNLHIVQSEMAEAEARTFMNVRWNLTMPQTNGPTMGIVQEALLGAHLLTREGTYLTREEMGKLMASLENPHGKAGKCILPSPAVPALESPRGIDLWTGKQAFSMVLPASLNLTRVVRNAAGSSSTDEEDMRRSEQIIQICNGELYEGVMGKDMLGTKKGSLVHRIRQDFGDEAAMHFLTDVQNLVHTWLSSQGFSVGLTDCALPSHVERAIRRDMYMGTSSVTQLFQYMEDVKKPLRGAVGGVEMASLRIEELLDKVQTRATGLVMGHMRSVIGTQKQTTSTNEAVAGSTNTGRCSSKVEQYNQMLGKNVTKPQHPWGNRLMQMVWAASKGGVPNLSQILANVGQQNLHSKRIQLNSKANRSVPHFAHGSRDVASQGFCYNSYYRGLTPCEQYMHAMSGREGLVNTAVTTSETGYMSRKIRALLEHISTSHSCAAVDNYGMCIQPVYGGDGMDPCEIEAIQLPALVASNARIRDLCAGHEAYGRLLMRLRDDVRASRTSILSPVINTKALLPVNVPSILSIEGSGEPEGAGTALPSVDMEYIYEKVAETCKKLESALSRDATLALQLHVAWELAPTNAKDSLSRGKKDLVHQQPKLTESIIRQTCDAVLVAFDGAKIEGGTACGVLAAGSAGAPSTQMSLDSFHNTGQRHVALQTGVPRMRELIQATVDIRTPSMIAPIRESALPPYPAKDASESERKHAILARKKAANRFARLLRSLTLREVVAEDRILYDPVVCEEDPGALTSFVTDATWMRETADVFGRELDLFGDDAKAACSPWVIRLKLDRAVLKERGGTPSLMARAVQRFCSSQEIPCTIVFSDVTQHPWIIRIRPVHCEHTEAFSRSLKGDIMTNACANGMLGLKLANAVERNIQVHDHETGELISRTEWVIQTQGSTLSDLSRVPFINWRRSTTNDAHQALSLLGVEAARNVQHYELHALLNLKTYVDPRHTALIADAQTARGYVLSATRHGINRINTGVLQRACFEEMMDMIEDAATYEETDHLAGVSENICVGQVTPVGTGTVAIQRLTDTSAQTMKQNDLLHLREREPCPYNVDIRTGIEVSRAVARKMPMNFRASKKDAEAARRRGTEMVEPQDRNVLLSTVAPRDAVSSSHGRGASLNAVQAEKARNEICVTPETDIDTELIVAQLQRMYENNALYHSYLIDADGAEILQAGETSLDLKEVSGSARHNEALLIRVGQRLPGKTVEFVEIHGLHVLSQRVESACASLHVGTYAPNSNERVDAVSNMVPWNPANAKQTRIRLRNVRVELSGVHGVFFEEWTRVSAHEKGQTNGHLEQAKTRYVAAPATWRPAAHASSSRTDPWKGAPVRDLAGNMVHSGGDRDLSSVQGHYGPLQLRGAHSHANSNCATAGSMSAAFRPASPTYLEG